MMILKAVQAFKKIKFQYQGAERHKININIQSHEYSKFQNTAMNMVISILKAVQALQR